MARNNVVDSGYSSIFKEMIAKSHVDEEMSSKRLSEIYDIPIRLVYEWSKQYRMKKDKDSSVDEEKNYSPDFKAMICNLNITHHNSIKSISNQFNLSKNVIKGWISDYKKECAMVDTTEKLNISAEKDVAEQVIEKQEDKACKISGFSSKDLAIIKGVFEEDKSIPEVIEGCVVGECHACSVVLDYILLNHVDTKDMQEVIEYCLKSVDFDTDQAIIYEYFTTGKNMKDLRTKYRKSLVSISQLIKCYAVANNIDFYKFKDNLSVYTKEHKIPMCDGTVKETNVMFEEKKLKKDCVMYSEEDKEKVINCWKNDENLTCRDVSKKFGVPESTVSRWIRMVIPEDERKRRNDKRRCSEKYDHEKIYRVFSSEELDAINARMKYGVSIAKMCEMLNVSHESVRKLLIDYALVNEVDVNKLGISPIDTLSYYSGGQMSLILNKYFASASYNSEIFAEVGIDKRKLYSVVKNLSLVEGIDYFKFKNNRKLYVQDGVVPMRDGTECPVNEILRKYEDEEVMKEVAKDASATEVVEVQDRENSKQVIEEKSDLKTCSDFQIIEHLRKELASAKDLNKALQEQVNELSHQNVILRDTLATLMK